MRDYEFTAIFNSDEEMATNGAEYVQKKFDEAGVQVSKKEDMGVRQLAYIIKKQEKGHYCYYEIQADPASVAKLSADFLLSGLLLKFLFIVK